MQPSFLMPAPLCNGAPHLRVARPSRDLHAATRLYTEGLGFDVLASFLDHAGFDGVMLGRAGWPYHLELTQRRDDPIAPRPTAEDLLVLYLPDRAHWEAAVRRLRDAGARSVASVNPYWDARGATFEDPDGYRIVLANDAWP
ncbi:MAG TPA: VOC family protein [Gemmatimonadaceae bacterium]|jgi:catechol 2,3-dioxygenase-like lactoylglutathione lyase family enzyme|nr:VOC family protein [Gemmatimonadaceae bacterium]